MEKFWFDCCFGCDRSRTRSGVDLRYRRMRFTAFQCGRPGFAIYRHIVLTAKLCLVGLFVLVMLV
jgi:hypothetical protein